ncbi:MAG: hypothetical protein ISS36_02145 [Candidatus Aenigmarchaeota archaeon]|nr:hypothetical protein [Candidatus Aenigmarchaeota archaeon]
MPPIAGMMEIINQLPQILFFSQIIFYVFFILFFGSLATRFYRAYIHPILKFLLGIGIGFLCLISAVPLSGFFQSFSTGILKLMQIDLFIGGLVSSIVFGIGLFFVTYRREDIERLKGVIKKLENRINTAKKFEGKGINKFTIIGIVIIIAFVAYLLLNFQGLPDTNEDLYSMLGMSPDDLKNISNLLEQGEVGGIQMPPGCEIEGEYIKCPLSELQVT